MMLSDGKEKRQGVTALSQACSHGGERYAGDRPLALSSPQGKGWDLGIGEGL